MKKQTKALVLFSGGLDSRIVIKMLQDQNIEVEAVYVKLPFGNGCCNNFECVFNYSQIQGVKLHVIDATKSPLFEEYIELIKKPKHGYGKSLNPCKDCKVFILKKAKELADKLNVDIIATGEVIGQRPNSQQKSHMGLIEEKAGVSGKILRPLSAKLLPETQMEKDKLVNRNLLEGIEGRRRIRQIELAKKYNIKYPDPAGGCILCEKNYIPKIKDLFNNKEDLKYEDIQLLDIGRHFRSAKTKGKIILGKNEKENDFLIEFNKKLKQNIIVPEEFAGPTVVFENINDKVLAEELQKTYSLNDLELRKKFEKIKI